MGDSLRQTAEPSPRASDSVSCRSVSRERPGLAKPTGPELTELLAFLRPGARSQMAFLKPDLLELYLARIRHYIGFIK